VDFDFRKTGRQLTAFFAGPLFAVNLSRQVNTHFRWGVDLSLSALPATSYRYSGNTELVDERVTRFGQWAGVLLAWQATPALELSAQVDVNHDLYRTTDETAPDYVLPPSGLTLDLDGQFKFVKKGFNGVASVEHGRRATWHEFGKPGELSPSLPNWTRYSVDVSQHLFVGKLTRGGVAAGYYGGHDLDRFSYYSPSLMGRPSIRGLPSGADSFSEIATLGGYYGFNVMDLAKLQAGYSHAWTRNKDEGNARQQFDGLDFSIGIAGPFGTFMQGSISVALHGNLDRYPSRWGTYLMFFKPWKK
jgi:hypothetical protein